MFTDMVGYTPSAHQDEGGTLGRLREQTELLRPLVAIHQGREIKSTGDGFLVEFDSALKATQCAVSIQRRIFERNAEAGLPPIQIRIGIHLGEVIRSGSDILGDAVNVAARIEPIAEPGGICFSGAVYEQVRNKIPDPIEKLPPTMLKGLGEEIDIYRVILPWNSREIAPPRDGPAGLAVLPFTNMSPDTADMYFADGLTEELITVLSQLRELRVIARTSVMQYKSTAKSVSQIGSELGVSSVLEGSVRRAGDRLRITAQLIDVGSQGHRWSKSYDRVLDDIFEVQTEIAKQVADALRLELGPTDRVRLDSRYSIRADSYLAYLKGRTLMHSATGTNEPTLRAAQAQFETAISLDPRNAAAYAGSAGVVTRLGWWHRDVPPEESHATAMRLTKRAIELDPNLAEAHESLGLLLWGESIDQAEKEFRLALSLNPSFSEAHNSLANLLQDDNRPEEALVEFALAEEADPHWRLNLYHLSNLLIWLGRFDEAFAKIEKIGTLIPDEGKARSEYHLERADFYLSRSDLVHSLEEIELAQQAGAAPRDIELARALYYAAAGESEKARPILRHDETLQDRPVKAQFIARVYAELGDLDGCFRWMNKAAATKNLSLQRWRLDPRLAAVRRDPRFRLILEKRHLT